MIAVLVWSALCAMAQAQTPRRIAPELFPDYGVRAEPAPSAPFRLETPSDARPLGACTRDMAQPIWFRCLRETANAADEALVATIARIKVAFEARNDVTPVLRSAWGRSLDESLTRWRALRDYECQQLGMAEKDAVRDLLEARTICLIHRSRERAGELLSRFHRDDAAPAQSAAP